MVNINRTLRWAPEDTGTLTYPLEDVDRLYGPAISPRAGNPHNYPEPMKVGGREHRDAYDEICETLAHVRAGRWPTEILERHGLPTSLDEIPTPLAMLVYEAAKANGISEVMAAAQFVRMDDWRQPATIMLGHALASGAELKEKFRAQGRASGRVKHFDLIGLQRAHLHIGCEVSDEMDRCFDTKYHYGFPRPYQCSNTPRGLFTVYPHLNGGDHHPEYGPGHAVNGAQSAMSVLDATTLEAGSVAHQENLVMGNCVGWFRCLAGLHYFTHCTRVFDHLTKW